MKKPILFCFLTCLFLQQAVLSQTIPVTGKIISADDKLPVSGASITLKGGTGGTTSDEKGNFSITVSPNAVLLISFVNFQPTEVPVNGRNNITVSLTALDKSLEQVVVVGYGTQRKKDLTGSVVSVKGSDLRQVPTVNAIKSMQGLVAGVDIASPNNNPNSNPEIRIRGNRSINAGNDPLIVVDGLPFSGSLNDINSGDIRSIEVLKDASATAIYGSRGANGVILITSNRGTTGKVQINYNGYYGVQTALDRLRLMNGAEFAEFRREAERNANRYNSLTPSRTLDEGMFYFRNRDVEASVLQAYDANGNYDPSKVREFDWIGEVTRQGRQQEHQLSVLAGSAKSQTSFSLGYFDNVGVVKGFDFDRYNLRLTYDNQLYDRLKIGGTIAASINNNNSTDNLYLLGGQVNPLAPIRDSTGALIIEPASDPLNFNSLIRLEGASNKEKAHRFFGNFFAEAGLIPGLTYRLSFSPDYRFFRRGSFRTSRANQGSPSSASDTTNRAFHYVLDNMLMYNKVINTDHKINVTLLQSVEEDRVEASIASVNDLPYDQQAFYNLGTANIVSRIGTGLTEWTLSSFMARVNYGFKERYLLTLTGRYDGSSRLAPGNKWDFFPSTAFAWNASDEPFLQSSKTLSDL
ncbi:MAG: SusC/RagA family TonB-linked outer membrane protein, partial [Chitinophagaceae bacterium]|nr:SusC/RagA family TonB-linked outer membrane protein [Chitinophagaceae bacterium]